MKFIMACLFGFLAQPAFACVDISGKYLMGSTFYIQYQQKGCETLIQNWCGPGGKDCGTKAYTWTLDGNMVRDGGNPSNWASISPEGNLPHRTQLWDSGTVNNGRQCWWKNLWYAKDAAGNLKVTYKLSCAQGNGKEVIEMTEETWTLVN